METLNAGVVEPQPKPEWSAVPREGCKGVEFRVLLRRQGLIVANLRFAAGATIDRHSAPHDIDVVCVAGSGFTSVGDQTSPLRAGHTVRWSAGVDHCLWTDGEGMETLMLEHYRG